jgi:hypothetical protein
MSIVKFNDLTGNRTRDFLACSIVPQQTTLPQSSSSSGSSGSGGGGSSSSSNRDFTYVCHN